MEGGSAICLLRGVFWGLGRPRPGASRRRTRPSFRQSSADLVAVFADALAARPAFVAVFTALAGLRGAALTVGPVKDPKSRRLRQVNLRTLGVGAPPDAASDRRRTGRELGTPERPRADAPRSPSRPSFSPVDDPSGPTPLPPLCSCSRAGPPRRPPRAAAPSAPRACRRRPAAAARPPPAPAVPAPAARPAGRCRRRRRRRARRRCSSGGVAAAVRPVREEDPHCCAAMRAPPTSKRFAGLCTQPNISQRARLSCP